jgi:transketolase
MGEVQGQGYIGQALGHRRRAGDGLLPRDELRPEDPTGRAATASCCRNGHYAIALVRRADRGRRSSPRTSSRPTAATTAACRCRAWRPTRRAWRCPAARSARACPIAVGHALGLRARAPRPRVHARSPTANSTRARPGRRRWAPPTTARQPDRDRRRQQPAGRRPLEQGDGFRAPGADKMEAFGWHPAHRRQRPRRRGRRVRRRARRCPEAKPRMIVCDT